MSASWQLQQALIAALNLDTALLALVGGARVFDHPPLRARLPYVTLGVTLTNDWSTSTEEGSEHILTLHSWTESNSRQQAHEIEAAIVTAISSLSPSLSGHRLINARHQFSEIRRDPEGDAFHGIIRFRLVTEPA